MTEFSSLRRGPLVELAVQQLSRLVTGGHWPVGERLPAEAELAGRLGVGRSTVREAVRALVHAGLLETRQGAGTFVVSLTPPNAWEARLRRAELLEVYEVRQALETKAAVLAAERRTPADIENIEATLKERQRARAQASDPIAGRGWRGGNKREFIAADLAFHHAVVTATHNPLLIEVFTSFTPVLQDGLLAIQDISHPDTSDAHDMLAAAIRDGDPATALRATELNLDVTAATLDTEG